MTRTLTRQKPWWHTALLIIGCVALGTAVGVIFFGFNGAPERITTSTIVPPVETPEFTASLSRLVGAPVEQGGTVEVLNNGDEFAPALLQSLEAAKRSINFSVFVWEDGEFSNRIIETLTRRQDAGVVVRVLLDGWGGMHAPEKRLEELERRGGKVETFRLPTLGSWMRVHRRNHRRSIVIDGQVGFTGGMAVKDVWLGHAQDPDHWRDMMVKVTGPMAASLQTAFAGAWASTSGELLVGPEMATSPEPGDVPGVARFLHHVNSPADDDHSMMHFFLTSILAARQRIVITTPYFIPDASLSRALQDKARAGVDVRLLVPGPHTDNQITRASGQNRYEELLKAGVKIYEYQPTFVHAKYMVVDSQWSIVGSANFDSRSRQLDEENTLGILDPGLGAVLESTFSKDLESSKEINLDAWRKRGVTTRAMQMLSRLLDQQQ